MQRWAARPGVRKAFRIAGPLLVMALLGGCLFPPTPETTQAKDVFTLYVVVFIMGAVVFFGVEGAIVYSIIRYRRRDDRLPDQLHGHTLIEILWTAIPTVIVMFLFVWSTITLGTTQAKSDPAVTIEVTGFQWQWTFHYLDGDNDPKNDYSVTGTAANPPVMGLPTGEPIRLILKSSDVIHSFFVPHFLVKRDVIPFPNGINPNELEFTVSDPGTYGGQCAEFCGDLHSKMTFTVEAMAPAAFQTWLADAKAGKTPPPTGTPRVIRVTRTPAGCRGDQAERPERRVQHVEPAGPSRQALRDPLRQQGRGRAQRWDLPGRQGGLHRPDRDRPHDD